MVNSFDRQVQSQFVVYEQDQDQINSLLTDLVSSLDT